MCYAAGVGPGYASSPPPMWGVLADVLECRLKLLGIRGVAQGEQKEILDLIAYSKNAASDPSLSQAVVFFAFLRDLTADGFFTSEIGIKYLGYIGNTFVNEFPGCPSVPGI